MYRHLAVVLIIFSPTALAQLIPPSNRTELSAYCCNLSGPYGFRFGTTGPITLTFNDPVIFGRLAGNLFAESPGYGVLRVSSSGSMSTAAPVSNPFLVMDAFAGFTD